MVGEGFGEYYLLLIILACNSNSNNRERWGRLCPVIGRPMLTRHEKGSDSEGSGQTKVQTWSWLCRELFLALLISLHLSILNTNTGLLGLEGFADY